MMKIVAAVLCLSVLVSSQDIFGDGMGGLFAINLLSGRQPLDLSALFGGRPAAYPVAMPSSAARGTPQQQQQQQAAAMAAMAARRSPLSGLGGLLLLDGMGVM